MKLHHHSTNVVHLPPLASNTRNIEHILTHPDVSNARLYNSPVSRDITFIIAKIKHLEHKYTPLNYFSRANNQNFSPKNRETIIEWIIAVTNVSALNPDVAYLATNIFDRTIHKLINKNTTPTTTTSPYKNNPVQTEEKSSHTPINNNDNNTDTSNKNGNNRDNVAGVAASESERIALILSKLLSNAEQLLENLPLIQAIAAACVFISVKVVHNFRPFFRDFSKWIVGQSTILNDIVVYLGEGDDGGNTSSSSSCGGFTSIGSCVLVYLESHILSLLDFDIVSTPTCSETLSLLCCMIGSRPGSTHFKAAFALLDIALVSHTLFLHDLTDNDRFLNLSPSRLAAAVLYLGLLSESGEFKRELFASLRFLDVFESEAEIQKIVQDAHDAHYIYNRNSRGTTVWPMALQKLGFNESIVAEDACKLVSLLRVVIRNRGNLRLPYHTNAPIYEPKFMENQNISSKPPLEHNNNNNENDNNSNNNNNNKKKNNSAEQQQAPAAPDVTSFLCNFFNVPSRMTNLHLLIPPLPAYTAMDSEPSTTPFSLPSPLVLPPPPEALSIWTLPKLLRSLRSTLCSPILRQLERQPPPLIPPSRRILSCCSLLYRRTCGIGGPMGFHEAPGGRMDEEDTTSVIGSSSTTLESVLLSGFSRYSHLLTPHYHCRRGESSLSLRRKNSLPPPPILIPEKKPAQMNSKRQRLSCSFDLSQHSSLSSASTCVPSSVSSKSLLVPNFDLSHPSQNKSSPFVPFKQLFSSAEQQNASCATTSASSSMALAASSAIIFMAGGGGAASNTNDDSYIISPPPSSPGGIINLTDNNISSANYTYEYTSNIGNTNYYSGSFGSINSASGFNTNASGASGFSLCSSLASRLLCRRNRQLDGSVDILDCAVCVLCGARGDEDQVGVMHCCFTFTCDTCHNKVLDDLLHMGVSGVDSVVNSACANPLCRQYANSVMLQVLYEGDDPRYLMHDKHDVDLHKRQMLFAGKPTLEQAVEKVQAIYGSRVEGLSAIPSDDVFQRTQVLWSRLMFEIRMADQRYSALAYSQMLNEKNIISAQQ